MLTVLDLFSGTGGFSLGLEKTGGFETTAFCEIDDDCRRVLNKHWPGILKFRDVKNLRPKVGDYDVIVGSFPCQDISVAGLKKGFNDEGEILSNFEREFTELLTSKGRIKRNSKGDFSGLCKRVEKASRNLKAKTTRSGLWKEFYRTIKEAKPRYAIIENVANLRSSGLNQIIEDLWKIGYASEWHIISARSAGAPHLRERIWIIAYPDSQQLRLESGRRVRKKGESSPLVGGPGPKGDDLTSDTYNLRLWQSFTSEEEKSKWWTETAASLGCWSKTKPPICGVDDGISKELDKSRKARIKQLGNAVVPAIPQFIGQSILDWEERNG